ncbi:MAG: hypothetical protein LBE91_16195 [Tannerella sp.]|jgi:hypothetical protein|nr:hypothetical protein [Tannerella sp.]
MKKQLTLLIILLFSIIFTACKGNEKLAVAGSGWNEIAIIDKKTGNIEWKHELSSGDECNSIKITEKGYVLYAYKNGARLINRDHEQIWDYAAREGEEIHSASQLPDGGFLIGVCGQPARIVELDKEGKQRKEIAFNTVTFNTNYQFRQISKTDSDTYLIPMIEKRKVVELTSEGKSKRSVILNYDLFSIKEIQDGNWIVSGGLNRCLLAVNPRNPLEETYVTGSVKGASLQFVGEIIPYGNGHALIANGRLPDGSAGNPLLIEIDEKNEVVWTLPYNRDIRNINAVYSFFE